MLYAPQITNMMQTGAKEGMMTLKAALNDLGHHLMTGNYRQVLGWGTPFDFIQLGMAYTTGTHLEQHFTGCRCWCLKLYPL